MKVEIKFSDKELEDISQALKLASIHTQAGGESQRMHILSQKIISVFKLNHALKQG